MAFLCPVRIRRNKKKHDAGGGTQFDSQLLMAGLASRATPSSGMMMGRITGSASIETLVRVGLEKEAGLSPDSKMMVMHDFQPCVDDELCVSRGQMVNVLYQENDWVYVIAENQTEGFIPFSYCAPIDPGPGDNPGTIYKKKMPRTAPNSPNSSKQPLQSSASSCVGKSTGAIGRDPATVFKNATLPRTFGSANAANPYSIKSLLLNQSTSRMGEVMNFNREPLGKFVVLWPYSGVDENDLSVEQAEVVTVLNRDDPDWLWAQRSDHSSEGFVPATHLCPLEMLLNAHSSRLILNQYSTSQEQVPFNAYDECQIEDECNNNNVPTTTNNNNNSTHNKNSAHLSATLESPVTS